MLDEKTNLEVRMIINKAGTQAISNMGWIDRGSLWSYMLGGSGPSQVRLSVAKWLSIVEGIEEHFAVVHHFEDGSIDITAHSFQDVTQVISCIELRKSESKSSHASSLGVSTFNGDSSVWSSLPKAYIFNSLEDAVLLLVEGGQKKVQIQSLPWYKEGFDLLYQGIVSVTKVPGVSLLVVSIQRDSEPVLYDPTSKKVIRKIKLAGRLGNPQLFFRRKVPELWASDYDSLLRLDIQSWNVLDVLKLQEPKGEMKKMNVGEYCFDIDEGYCVVARPYSGDVVGIDTNTFKIALRADTGGQPQEVGALRGGFVVARDLQTGQLLESTLKRV
jgi:hypothetical protein